jgi:hypothetical protein
MTDVSSAAVEEEEEASLKATGMGCIVNILSATIPDDRSFGSREKSSIIYVRSKQIQPSRRRPFSWGISHRGDVRNEDWQLLHPTFFLGGVIVAFLAAITGDR